jgi:site-specific DNA-methyltransferase (adenine-specific)
VIRPEIQSLATPITQLKPHPQNVRQGDVGAISQSLEQHGQYRPIVVQQSTGFILAGNHTYKAAKALKWKDIAATYVDVDDEQALRILLIDNRANDLASYDDSALVEMLKALMDTELKLDGTGFDPSDLDQLLKDLEMETELPSVGDVDESVPLLDLVPSKTMTGDVWLLGNHRIMCGSSQSSTDVEKLLNGSKINLAFTSPPYAEQRKYDEDSSFKPIPPEQYLEWFLLISANVKANLEKDGSWFINIKPASENFDTSLYVFDLVLAHVRQWGWHFATEFCWERSGIPQQVVRRFKNQFEPIYQFTLGEWKIRPDNVQHESTNVPQAIGKGAGDTSAAKRQGVVGAVAGNLIQEGMAYPGNRLPTFSGSHEATGHSAAFPVGLPEWFIKAYTDQNDSIYDPFMGSGSTLLAAHKQNRIAYGMEISPRYCDLICARFQQATGITPIAEATGNEHSFIE